MLFKIFLFKSWMLSESESFDIIDIETDGNQAGLVSKTLSNDTLLRGPWTSATSRPRKDRFQVRDCYIYFRLVLKAVQLNLRTKLWLTVSRYLSSSFRFSKALALRYPRVLNATDQRTLCATPWNAENLTE